MLKIALTGNIASGKSTLQKYFVNKGFVCLCLDKVVQNIYDNDTDFQNELILNFKTKIKSEIAKIVFSDINKLKKLESLIYPRVFTVLDNFFKDNKNKSSVMVAIPMLFETGYEKYFDKVIFVSAKEDIRLNRLVKRDNLTIDEAKRRIIAQEAETDKIAKSDFVIYNNGSYDELFDKNKEVIESINTLL